MESKQEQRHDTIADILGGSCSVGFLDCPIVEFARGVKYFIDHESNSIRCDTHLLNVLRRAACAAWELANAGGPGLAYQLAEARRDERRKMLKVVKALAYETVPGEVNHNEGIDMMRRDTVLDALAQTAGDQIAADKQESLSIAVRQMRQRHKHKAELSNFDDCGCEDCRSLEAALKGS